VPSVSPRLPVLRSPSPAAESELVRHPASPFCSQNFLLVMSVWRLFASGWRRSGLFSSYESLKVFFLCLIFSFCVMKFIIRTILPSQTYYARCYRKLTLNNFRVSPPPSSQAMPVMEGAGVNTVICRKFF
jgi:hypothetical protein